MVLVDKMAAQISVYFLIIRYCFIRCVHATKTRGWKRHCEQRAACVSISTATSVATSFPMSIAGDEKAGLYTAGSRL